MTMMLDSSARFRIGNARIYYGWVIVVATLILFSAAFAVQSSFGIFFTPIQETFGWSRAVTSLAMTIQVILYALAMLPSAHLIERFGVRRVFAVAALVIGLSVTASSRITEPWQFYLLFGLLFGSGLGVFGAAPQSLVARWFTEKRGIALGISSSGAGIAILLGPPLANALIYTFGWRTSFLILGAGATVILLSCVYFFKDAPEVPLTNSTSGADIHSGGAARMSLADAMRTREIFLIVVIHACSMFALKMVMVHLAPHALDMGIPPATAALAVSTLGGVSIVGRLLMGYVQDRIGPRRSILICVVAQTVAMLALPAIYWGPLLFVFAAAFGFAYGGDMPQYPAITAQYFGLASVGIVYSFVAMAGNLVGALGPLIAGYVFDLTNSYTAVFLLSAVSLIGALFCVLKLKDETGN